MMLSSSTDIRRCRPHLGTFVEVRASGLEERQAVAAVEHAFKRVAKVEKHMSAHDPQSDLGRLYERGFHQPIRVHPWTYAVIEAALRLHRLSGGVFDVSVGDVLEKNGFLPPWSSETGAGPSPKSSDIVLKRGFRIRLHRPVRIDLGGIAKGFAVDRAVEALMEAGAVAGSVNAGGDFRVFGPKAEPLVLRHPADPSRLVRVGAIRAVAVATSAAYFSRRQRGNRVMTPMVEGPTRVPMDPNGSITVLAPACMWADALTKVMALHRRRGTPLLRLFRARALYLGPDPEKIDLQIIPDPKTLRPSRSALESVS